MGMAAEDEDPDIYIGDVVSGDGLDEAIDGCDALVILTSGVPKLRKREIFKSVLFKLIGQQRLPKFYYDQMPEQVDWIGCRNQIDAAKKAGVQHIVLVSSMGVSPQKNTPDNILNKVRAKHSPLPHAHTHTPSTHQNECAALSSNPPSVIQPRAPSLKPVRNAPTRPRRAAGRRQHPGVEGQGRGVPQAVGGALHHHPPGRPPHQARCGSWREAPPPHPPMPAADPSYVAAAVAAAAAAEAVESEATAATTPPQGAVLTRAPPNAPGATRVAKMQCGGGRDLSRIPAFIGNQ